MPLRDPAHAIPGGCSEQGACRAREHTHAALSAEALRNSTHSQDIGHNPRKPDTRVYATSLGQPFHTDSSDMVGAAQNLIKLLLVLMLLLLPLGICLLTLLIQSNTAR